MNNQASADAVTEIERGGEMIQVYVSAIWIPRNHSTGERGHCGEIVSAVLMDSGEEIALTPEEQDHCKLAIEEEFVCSLCNRMVEERVYSIAR